MGAGVITIAGTDRSTVVDGEQSVVERKANFFNSIARLVLRDEGPVTGQTPIALRERQDVIITDGGTRIFGGQISGLTPVVHGKSIVWTIIAQNYTCLLDQDVITSGSRTGVRYDDDDATWLRSQTTHGITVGSIRRTRSTALPDIDYTGMTLRQAFAELARYCRVRYWVTDNKALYWTHPKLDELVTSGDFEDNASGWTLDAAATRTADVGPAGTGDYAIKTIGSGSGSKESTYDVTVTAGARYLFTADMKGTAAQVRLEWRTATATISTSTVLGSSATYVTKTSVVTAPATATILRVKIGGTSGFNSTVYHDNVSVTKETAAFGVSTTPDGTIDKSMRDWNRTSEAPQPVNRVFVDGTGISGWREHAPSIAYYGGTKYEGYISDDRVTTTNDLDAKADAVFYDFAFPRYTGSYVTQYSGLNPGDWQIVTQEVMGLQTIEWISGVSVTFDGNLNCSYAVTYGQQPTDVGEMLHGHAKKEPKVKSIRTGHHKDGAVTGGKIAGKTITGANIADATITDALIVGGTISNASIAAGTITDSLIANATITGGSIAGSTITDANIAANTITAGSLAANCITASEISAGAISSTTFFAVNVVTDPKIGGDLTGRQFGAASGGAASPGFYFDSGGDYGFYFSSSTIRVAINGALKWYFSSTDAVSSMDVRPSGSASYDLGSATSYWATVHYQTLTAHSDARSKTDVIDTPIGLSFLQRLKPRAYRWKDAADTQAIQAAKGALDENALEAELAPVIAEFEATSKEEPETRRALQEQMSVIRKRHLGPIKQARAKRRPGRRLHYGFIAQEVKAALDQAGIDSKDAGFWFEDPTGVQSLDYTGLISPLVAAVKELAQRLERVERRNG